MGLWIVVGLLEWTTQTMDHLTIHLLQPSSTTTFVYLPQPRDVLHGKERNEEKSNWGLSHVVVTRIHHDHDHNDALGWCT